MRRPCVLVLLFALVAATCSACTPDDAVLETLLYRCRTTPECGPGYACTTGGAVVGFDFCAPAPTPCNESTCDGRCTSDGTCLRGCDLFPTGPAGSCPIEGTTCVRYSNETRGVCYPVKSCDLTSDCASGVCLTELLSDGVGGHPNDLYCLPVPSGMSCQDGFVFLDFLGPDGYCVPACSTDLECPPTFGCLTIARVFGLTADPCFPGVIGTSCTDDTNCIFGRCLAFNGSGAKVCTLRCSEVEATPGSDCSSLEASDFLSAFRSWTCDRALDVCGPTYAPGFPCNAAYPCEAGLECRDLPGGAEANVCTTTCVTDDNCGPRGACYSGQCLGRLARGQICARDRQCRPGSTCLGLRCT